jgi:hypothetical protein
MTKGIKVKKSILNFLRRVLAASIFVALDFIADYIEAPKYFNYIFIGALIVYFTYELVESLWQDE